MDDATTLTTLTELASSLSLSVVLLYLLVTERKAHEFTRTQARADLMLLIGELNRSLVDISQVRYNASNRTTNATD